MRDKPHKQRRELRRMLARLRGVDDVQRRQLPLSVAGRSAVALRRIAVLELFGRIVHRVEPQPLAALRRLLPIHR
jgi:hypothetical protein